MGKNQHDDEVQDTERPPAPESEASPPPIADVVADAFEESAEAIGMIDVLLGGDGSASKTARHAASAIRKGKAAANVAGHALDRLGGALERIERATRPVRKAMERGAPIPRRVCAACQGAGEMSVIYNGARLVLPCGVCEGRGA